MEEGRSKRKKKSGARRDLHAPNFVDNPKLIKEETCHYTGPDLIAPFGESRHSRIGTESRRKTEERVKGIASTRVIKLKRCYTTLDPEAYSGEKRKVMDFRKVAHN